MPTRGAAALALLLFSAERIERVIAGPVLVGRSTGATDGSGAAPYRSSPSFLLFAILSLLLGALLLAAGKRVWRVTTALGAGLLVELLVWITIVNLLGDGVFGESATTSGLLVWGIVSISALVGAAVGAFFWRIGMTAMCLCGGMSLGLSIAMMARDCLPVAARWIIIAILSLVTLLVCPFTQKNVGMALATALTGSFLLFLGIDFLATQTMGMSLGLRFMLDGRDSHASDLARYDPPVVTRVLLAMGWVVAALATLGQTFLWRDPFIRTPLHLTTPRGSPETDNEKDVTVNAEVDEPAESFRTRMNRRYQTRLAMGEKELRRPAYGSEESEISAEVLHSHMKDLTDMTSPDDPPTPPASVLSTEWANNNLRSRPPTFFNEPISTPTALAVRNNPLPPAVPHFAPVIPIAGVAAASDPHQPTSAPLVKQDSTSTNSSHESRRSWRKPAPPVPAILLDHATDSGHTTEQLNLPTARWDPDSHGILMDNDRIGLGLANGLASGREQSIALTSSTPTSEDTSAFLNSDFGVIPPLPQPREENHTSNSLSFPTGPRLSMDSSLVAAEMSTGDRRAEEFVPFTVSPPSDEAMKHRSYPIEGYGSASMRTISDPTQVSEISLVERESFATASMTSGREAEMPDLVRDDETATSLASPATGVGPDGRRWEQPLGAGVDGGKHREEEQEHLRVQH